MHERLNRSVQEDGSKESWAHNCWSGQSGVAKDGEGNFFSAETGLEAAFNRRSALRESLWKDWNVDLH